MPVVVVLPAWANALAAQSITRGGLTGAVTDSAGAPVTGALVTLADQLVGGRQTVGVSSDGRFTFSLLSPGSYEVRAEQIGYRPVVVRDVRVGSGTQAMVAVTLMEDSLPVSRIDTLFWPGPALRSEPGASMALPDALVRRFAADRYDLTSLADFVTVAADDWGLLGLPGSATGLVIDGLPFEVARSSWLPLTDRFGPAFSRLAFAETAAELAPPDVEWGDFPGGSISAVTRRGTREMTAQAFGDWDPGAMNRSRFFDTGSLAPQAFLGGLVLAGPVRRDTADFVVGAEAEHLALPRPAVWPAVGADSAILTVALDSAGQSLADYLSPRLVTEDRVSGFGRLGWRMAPGQDLSVWVSGGRFTQQEPSGGPWAAPGLGSQVEGTDVAAAASVTSRLSQRLANELRAGFVNSQRQYTAGPLAATFFADGQAAGTAPTVAGRADLTAVRVRDDLLVDLGAHQVKLGLGGALHRYGEPYAPGIGSTFYFTDAAALGARRGAYYGNAGAQPGAQFSVPVLSALLQDRWEVVPGFAFLVGVRYDLELLPRSSIPPNQAWLSLTGLANDSIPRSMGKWSSRLGFDWRAGRNQAWHVRGGLGVYYGQTDPGVLAELITQAGQDDVHRGIGALGTWPAPPNAVAPSVGARLTLLGPAFQPPRTGRASVGIGRSLGRSGTIEVALDVGHTDFLPRRHDLNRPLGLSGRDQDGRPLYATLSKEGSVVAPDPSSGRRFQGFEMVSALDPDGYADYVGLTFRVVQPMGRFLRLYGSYTYSQATDNWLSGRHNGPYGQLTPFPDSLDGQDWATGTSDLDVPHRVAVGVELRPGGSDAVTLAARYRWQSGAPFTPGLAPGVDANGDGSFTNDPAFVDATLPGMSDLLGAWSCLRPQVAEFARRNSCRDPGVGVIDLRLGIAPSRRYPVELWVEAFNLAEPEQGRWDHALNLVDAAAPITIDGATGRVTVPYVANPNFGKRLALQTAGRTVRLGLRVNY